MRAAWIMESGEYNANGVSGQMPLITGTSTVFGSATTAKLAVDPGKADEVKNGL